MFKYGSKHLMVIWSLSLIHISTPPALQKQRRGCILRFLLRLTADISQNAAVGVEDLALSLIHILMN